MIVIEILNLIRLNDCGRCLKFILQKRVGKFPLMSMGGQAHSLACEDQGQDFLSAWT